MSNAANLVGKKGVYNTSALLPEGLFLGHKLDFTDGRLFRLCKAGATELAPGKLCVHSDDVANHLSMAPTAAAIGAFKVTVTLGATAATANQYREGFLVIATTGTQYKVKSHPAADASATLVLTLYDPLAVALAGSEEVDLVACIYNGTIVAVTDQADIPVGWPLVTVAIGYYYWSCVKGPCPMLMDENAARGKELVPGTSVAGAVEVSDLVGEVTVGVCIQAGVDTEYGQGYAKLE